MPTDSLLNARYPSLTSAVNVPQDIQNAVFDISSKAIPRFASTAARTSAYSAWVSAGGVMVSGMFCYVTGFGLCAYDATLGKWIDSTPPVVITTDSFWTPNVSGETPLTYWRDIYNMVHVGGHIRVNSTYTPGTTSGYIFTTLPVGFRPPGYQVYPVTTTTVGDLIIQGDVGANGQMRMIRSNTGSIASGTIHGFYVQFPAA